MPGWSALQARRLVRALTPTPGPLVLMGDLNMGPGQATRVTGLRAVARTPTFPTDEPRRQLDHVLVRGGIRATGPAETPGLPLSDHRPLVVPCGPA
jgi:endonuclease/exonuclease/phosphatase family metal-dependent hydrolase